MICWLSWCCGGGAGFVDGCEVVEVGEAKKRGWKEGKIGKKYVLVKRFGRRYGRFLLSKL